MKTKQCQKCKEHQSAWIWNGEVKTHMQALFEMYDKGWSGEIPVECLSCGHKFKSYQWKHIPTKEWRAT